MAIQKVGWEPSPELVKKLESYKGKWVVIIGQDIVLADADREALHRNIEQQRLDWDSIEYIPRGDEPPLIL
jgi:hypothetical protein